jgi:hypothetical protein
LEVLRIGLIRSLVKRPIRTALAAPGRKGMRAIANEFGVGTGTVQRIKDELVPAA